MSVQESIETTVSLSWPGRKTIGTLASIGGDQLEVLSLSGPDVGGLMTVTVDGESAEEAIALDGVCSLSEPTSWGERRITMRIMRLGTVASATRLRTFIEQHDIQTGGAVHVGRTTGDLTKQRFVYSLPEPSEPVFSAELTMPDAPSLTTLKATDHGLSAPALEAAIASDLGAVAGQPADLDEIGVIEVDEQTLNSELAADMYLGESALDAALQQALKAVNAPPKAAVLADESQTAAETMELVNAPTVDPNVPSTQTEEFDPTRLISLSGFGGSSEPTPLPEAPDQPQFSRAETVQIQSAVDLAVKRSQDVEMDAEFDLSEPIIVATVAPSSPFASPVQLGHDNRAPTLAEAVIDAAGSGGGVFSLEMPEPAESTRATTRTANRTERIEAVAPSLASALTAPEPLSDSLEPKRKPSGSMRKLQALFTTDTAVRCDLTVKYKLGKKSINGKVVRLAESRLRIETTEVIPEPYSRIQVTFEDAANAKNKLTLHCEVLRIRDADDDREAAFDMRVSAGVNGPKEIERLREMIHQSGGLAAAPAES